MGSFKDISGQLFGELTAQEYIGNSMWKCICSCGNICIKNSWKLLNRKTITCGDAEKHRINLVGQKFNKYTVLEYSDDGQWSCQCECGTITKRTTKDLLNGKAVACRHCCNKEKRQKSIDELIGKNIGYLTVVRRADDYITKNGTRKPRCLCKCVCGKEIAVDISILKRQKIKSCGCKNNHSHEIRHDVSGERFGSLIALTRYVDKKRNKVYYKCQCDCGQITDVAFSNLLAGTTKSCGCQQHTGETHATGYEGEKIGNLTLIKRLDTKQNGCYEWLCHCDCGKTIVKSRAKLKQSLYPSCGCVSESNGEHKISDFLSKNNVTYIYNKTINDFYPQNELRKWNTRFDFLIIKDAHIVLIIEYDGNQHFMPIKKWHKDSFGYERCVILDSAKNDFCKKQQIPLVRIKYTQANKIESILSFALNNPSFFIDRLNPYLTNDEYYIDRAESSQMDEYLKVHNKNRNIIQDHQGNIFFSKTEMCKYWGIKPKTFDGRIQKMGLSLKDALTIPCGTIKRKGIRCEDHCGNEFDSITQMTQYYGINPSAFKKRILAGWSLKNALTTPIKPISKRSFYE